MMRRSLSSLTLLVASAISIALAQDTTPPVDNRTCPMMQLGQPNYCREWHIVVEGETCEDIWSQHRTWMTLADFFAWNPTVGKDCSGLYTGDYVCVDVPPQKALTITFPKPEKFTLPEYFSWTPAPLPTVDADFTPTPSHGPMPTNCISHYLVKAGETCDDVLADCELITREQFFEWNPVLGGNCYGLLADHYYCVFAFDKENLPLPATVKTKPENVPADSASNCVAWYRTTDGDDCYLISLIFSTFSEIDFKTWNPSVGSDCSSLEIGMYYCVPSPGVRPQGLRQSSRPSLRTISLQPL
ncbi:hypothetical protein SAPIO_CDS5827 [Scedosporium apiospermum]|uniref:LysM domain-containing protein n=1 Tax=Pseudallescheria apiosperma TaxID=563466 RepID=A0A084G5H9_PSEDA|nr:uncharacterized protein SAPIO_CDS5827 [Scedosporium apiospermum]KEZ42591.1 hypothetical protein SAPIO_CDS5827 [Scedosporium apiospermum]